MTAPGYPARQARLRKSYRQSKRTEIAGSVAAFFGIVLTIVFTLCLVGLLMAWPVMIALGIWHSYVPQVPALGLLATFVSVVAVHAVFHSANIVKKD